MIRLLVTRRASHSLAGLAHFETRILKHEFTNPYRSLRLRCSYSRIFSAFVTQNSVRVSLWLTPCIHFLCVIDGWRRARSIDRRTHLYSSKQKMYGPSHPHVFHASMTQMWHTVIGLIFPMNFGWFKQQRNVFPM